MLANFAKDVFANDIIYDGGVLECIQFNSIVLLIVRKKIFFCKKFKELKLTEKKVIMRKLGLCRKCLGHHDDDSKCRDMFLCRCKECKGGASADHHYLICPRGETKSEHEGRVTVRQGKKGSRLTVDQEEFLSELSFEMAERCMKAFTNRARMERSKEGKLGLLEENGLQELPVIMMLKEVTTNAGQKNRNSN